MKRSSPALSKKTKGSGSYILHPIPMQSHDDMFFFHPPMQTGVEDHFCQKNKGVEGLLIQLYSHLSKINKVVKWI